ncbi:MAG: hypothetical protein IJH07_09310 [Ruminococcus sp.]|nr:hypothetical protein [Ruminococcus sp.]
MKKISMIIVVSIFLAAIALLSACGIKETFYCEHCHQTKTDIPHHITVNTVDTTICSQCYKSYQKGEWIFP